MTDQMLVKSAPSEKVFSVLEEVYPNRRVFVINSLSAGPEIALTIDKLRELILAGKSYNEICKAITKYNKRTVLLFMLESMKNLANNGRVSPLVAKMADFWRSAWLERQAIRATLSL